MYLDLDKLRDLNFFQIVKELEAKIGSEKHLADQDLFNIALSSRTNIISERFNFQTHFIHNIERMRKALDISSNSILHFVGGIKPWHEWGWPPYTELWRTYAKKLKTFNVKTIPVSNISQMMHLSDIYYKDEKYKLASSMKSQIIKKLI